MSFYAEPRPRRRPLRDLDLNRLAETHDGWLGGPRTDDPRNPPAWWTDGTGPYRREETAVDLMDEESCPGCGAGEHESCGCFRGVHRAEETS